MNKKEEIEFLGKYFYIKEDQNPFDDFSLSFRFKKMFHFISVMIEHHPFVIAQFIGNMFQIQEFQFLKEQIYRDLQANVIFSFPRLSFQNKLSLTKMKLAYIIGSNQFYIPELAILINESMNEKPLIPNQPLSLGAQNILFKLLVLDRLETFQSGLHELIHEEEYEVYRAVKELEKKEILKIEIINSHRLIALDDKETIWNQAKPYLKSPVMQEIYVQRDSIHQWKEQLVSAGVFGLSKVGMIMEDEEEYAIESKLYKEIKDALEPSFQGHFDAVKLQIWKSKIVKLSSGLMNPFALYVSLQNENDERVQKDMEQYISQFWR
ncbi:MAG: hypothetical protein PHP32_00615 [Candidatus Izemoplasmatales bacterium]|nr:hypothetical protein [Candidatus Izemoplasmatales bacterium]